MNKDKRQSREPFRPENTPTPPQVMDASKEPVMGNNQSKQDKEENAKRNTPPHSDENKPKKKLLGESPMEIDDETTI